MKNLYHWMRLLPTGAVNLLSEEVKDRLSELEDHFDLPVTPREIRKPSYPMLRKWLDSAKATDRLTPADHAYAVDQIDSALVVSCQ